jgi:antitoxin (DNA-binding transcriptional repressor) of toxin-antitoxin stability system
MGYLHYLYYASIVQWLRATPGFPLALEKQKLYVLYRMSFSPEDTSMQIPISEVRAKLPQLIKQLHQDPSVIYEITVHQAVVAELKAPPQLPQGGEAAQALLALIDQLPPARSRPPRRVSAHVKAHLYTKPQDPTP